MPSEQAYRPASALPTEALLAARAQQLTLVKSWAAREAKRGDKAEKKAAILNGGYQKRAAALGAQLQEGAAGLRAAHEQLRCFEALAAAEGAELGRRLADARARLDAARAREAALQGQYATAMMGREAALDRANRAAAATAVAANGAQH